MRPPAPDWFVVAVLTLACLAGIGALWVMATVL
jgi:hypothetical protein